MTLLPSFLSSSRRRARASWCLAALGLLAALPFAATAATVAPARATGARPPIFVLNSLDASISVIDPATLTEIKRLPTGKEPHHLYLSPDEHSLLVANSQGDSLTVLDPATGALRGNVTGIADPYQLRFSPDMKWFVTAANRMNHLAIYRWSAAPGGPGTFTLVKKLAAGKTPSHLAIDDSSQTVYVTLQDSDQLMAVDLPTQTPRWTIATGKMPADVYITPDDKHLLVGLTGDEYVEVYDLGTGPAKLATRIRTGAGAHAFRAWGDGRHILVSNRVANTLSLIDLQTFSVADTFPAPGGPDCIDVMIDAQGKRTILVTSRWARRLTVIDPATHRVLRQVSVGRSPHGVWTLAHVGRR